MSSPIPASMYEQSGPKRDRSKWTIIGLLVVAFVVSAAVGLLRRSDDEASSATATDATDVAVGSTAATTVMAPVVPGARLAVGEVAVLTDGAVARARTVVDDAVPVDDFSAPAPGFRITRVVVEQCAGAEPLLVNSLYWSAFDSNDVAIDASIFGSDLASLEVLSGGCVSGTLDFEIADGTTIASIMLTDMFLTEVARWDTASQVEVTGPLASTVEPVTLDQATIADIENGGTAEVVSLRMNVPLDDTFFEPPAGWQLVELTVRMCAGSDQLMVNPEYWHLVTRVNYVASASINSGTLMFVDLAPGECTAGTVNMELPGDAVVKHVVLTDSIFTEAARWSMR